MYTEFSGYGGGGGGGGGTLKKHHVELIVAHAYAIKQGILYVIIGVFFSIT